jgi:hypothetical protein
MTSTMSTTELHVRLRADGYWGVWPDDDDHPVCLHEAAGPATWWALEHAEQHGATHVVVHDPHHGLRRLPVCVRRGRG